MEKLKIIKIGGKLIENEAAFGQFLKNFSELEGPRILVHGGGNFATELAERLGYETKMVDGRRITDENSLKVIVMTYAGVVNKSMVARLQGLGCNSIGLCGADGNSVISRRRPVKDVDFGFVGDVEKVNVDFIVSLLKQGITPVFSAISCTREGELLNTNGDSVASEIAKAMSGSFETELYYCFEIKGVLENYPDENSLITTLNRKKYEEMRESKAISAGMLPKLQNCFEALENGVERVFVGNADIIMKTNTCTQIIR